MNVIKTCHDDIGHLGIDKTVGLITNTYWFPNLRKTVRNYIQNCLKCLVYSPLEGRKEGFLHNIPKGDLPFQTIHVDHYGPLEITSKKKKYAFEIIDAFTKFVRLYPCVSTKCSEVIKHLRDYFRSFSVPQCVVSDRGSVFTSGDFTEFLNGYSITHVLIAVRTPRANGQIERINRLLTPMLAEFGLNQLGKSNDCVKEMLNCEHLAERNSNKIRQDAAEKIIASQTANKVYYDKTRRESTKYKIGDYVLIKNVDTSSGTNKKLLPKFRGPYEVKKVLEHDRYVIGDIERFQQTQMPYTSIVSPDQVKYWL